MRINCKNLLHRGIKTIVVVLLFSSNSYSQTIVSYKYEFNKCYSATKLVIKKWNFVIYNTDNSFELFYSTNNKYLPYKMDTVIVKGRFQKYKNIIRFTFENKFFNKKYVEYISKNDSLILAPIGNFKSFPPALTK